MDCDAAAFEGLAAVEARATSAFSADDDALFARAALPASATTTILIDGTNSFTTSAHVVNFTFSGVSLRMLSGFGGNAKAAPEFTLRYDGGTYANILLSRAVFVPLTLAASSGPCPAAMSAAACSLAAPLETYRVDVYRTANLFSYVSMPVPDAANNGGLLFATEALAFQLLVTVRVVCGAYVETSARVLQSADELVLAAWSAANSAPQQDPTPMFMQLNEGIMPLTGATLYGNVNAPDGSFPSGSLADLGARRVVTDSGDSDRSTQFPSVPSADSPYYFNVGGVDGSGAQIQTLGRVFFLRVPLGLAASSFPDVKAAAPNSNSSSGTTLWAMFALGAGAGASFALCLCLVYCALHFAPAERTLKNPKSPKSPKSPKTLVYSGGEQQLTGLF